MAYTKRNTNEFNSPGEQSDVDAVPSGPEFVSPPVCPRDEYSDTERQPGALVNKEDGWFYECQVSTIADEFSNDRGSQRGWVQRTRPYGAEGNPLEVAGTAGAIDDEAIDQGRAYQPGSGDQGATG